MTIRYQNIDFIAILIMFHGSSKKKLKSLAHRVKKF